MQPKIEKAFTAMRELEAGAIANPTENRMVGHYWLRNPLLATTPELRAEIQDTIKRIKRFAEDVHAGKIAAENGERFKHKTEEHTSELQSPYDLVCRLLLEKKKQKK